jgi:peptide/nickel transport system substrate-binding protein
MRMKRNAIALAAVVTLATAGLIGPVSVVAAAEDGEVPDTSLSVARPEDVRDLNPLRQANNATSEVTYQMHEGLVTLSPEQVITPALATDWELLEDGLTYRLTLREGVNFHSGAPFDAEAVKWNFEKQLKADPPGIAAGLLPSYSAINVVDDHTIDITLDEPNGVFVNILGAPLFMMVDPTRYEELGEDYNTNPSGTGPFRFVSWTPGQRVELEANPDYWNDENGPGVGKLTFEVIPEPAARIIALRNGEVDMAFTVPAEEVPSLASSDDIQVFNTPTMRVVFIGLNTLDPTLADVRVRQALSHATDLDQVDAIIGDNGVKATGMGMPTALGFSPSIMPHDPAAAAALLDEAGWTADGDGIREKDGQPLEVRVMTPARWPGEIEALQVIQSQWRNSGIDMKIEQIESGAMTAMLNEEAAKNVEDASHIPTYQGWTSGSGIRTGEVGYILERPKCDQGSRGWERFCDPAYDEAFALSQSTASLEERMAGYDAMAQIFQDNQLRLPIYVIQSNIAAGSDVQGFVPNPNDSLSMRGVSIEEG